MRRFLLCVCLPWFGMSASPTTQLALAEQTSQMYAQEIAKLPPPSRTPATKQCLEHASVWLSIDLEDLLYTPNPSPLTLFTEEKPWLLFKELGIEGVFFAKQRQAKSEEWVKVVNAAQSQRIALLGDWARSAMAPEADFQQALQNVGDYPTLYHLIEIDRRDWQWLPPATPGVQDVNVPWLNLQKLHQHHYISEEFHPFVKESQWNATGLIVGVDGKSRRWAYLKEGNNWPVLAWLSTSFAAYRLAAGKALQALFQEGRTILQVDGKIPLAAQETLSLWARKIGAYTTCKMESTLEKLKATPTDLVEEIATRPALLHALITEDAEALRMIYRLFAEENIEARRLVHVLQPFDRYVCDWVELVQQPQRKLRYSDEWTTAEVLHKRLLKEDLIRLEQKEPLGASTWVDSCARALGIDDVEKDRDKLLSAHLLLAFTYAMQPGAFSFSTADLLGVLPQETHALDLFGPSSKTLYSSLPTQLKNPRSFAAKLKAILAARREVGIATGELVSILPAKNRGSLLLVYRLPKNRFFYLLAINFSRKTVKETWTASEICNTWPIDAMTQLTEEKVFSSDEFSFTLPSLSGRAFYFQPQYYD